MKRILTSLLLIPLVLGIILRGPNWLVVSAIALVASLCFAEFRRLSEAYGVGRPGVWAFVAGLALLVVPGDRLLLATVIALTALALELVSADLNRVLPQAAALLFGLVYIFGALRCGIVLHEASPYWLLFALAINWIGDVSAYYVGQAIGRHKLAPVVSPGKSWEGAVASVVSSMAFAAFYFPAFLPQVPMVQALALSAVVNAAGQLGDLAESALKRGAGLKDSGSLLPGHGGMLDRMDSTLFTLPATALILQSLTQF